MKSLLAAAALLSFSVAGSAAAADAPSVLFPAPFAVEHQLVQTDSDGSEFRTDPVTDTYFGSHLVSVRADGSRVVVDFVRREITEVSVRKSTYWTLSFSRMGDLSHRLGRAQGGLAAAAPARPAAAGARPVIRVEEVGSDTSGRLPLTATAGAKPGIRHVRAFVEPGNAVDVWLDGSMRLGAAALDALEAFENEALGAGAPDGVGPAALVAAARRAADGGVPLRVRRPLPGGGTSEDVVLSLRPLPSVSQSLLVVGEGFRRVVSPLEEMVAFAEEEAARDPSRRFR